MGTLRLPVRASPHRGSFVDLPDELLAINFEERERGERTDRDAVHPLLIWDQPLTTSYLRLPTCDKFKMAAVSRRWRSTLG